MVTHAPLRRLMLTSRAIGSCPYGCSYCFKDFGGPVMQVLEDLHAGSVELNNVEVLYPACDVDLFASPNWEAALLHSLSLGKHVSLSTKAPLSSGTLRRLAAINCEFRDADRLLKISVSISTKYQARLEPHTPPYASRLRSLAGLDKIGVPTSVALRPILADVPFSEYVEVLKDCRAITQRVLFGDEWLDPVNPRPATGGESSSERVTWLPETRWVKRRDIAKRMRLTSSAKDMGYEYFDSDLDLMGSILSES